MPCERSISKVFHEFLPSFLSSLPVFVRFFPVWMSWIVYIYVSDKITIHLAWNLPPPYKPLRSRKDVCLTVLHCMSIFTSWDYFLKDLIFFLVHLLLENNKMQIFIYTLTCRKNASKECFQASFLAGWKRICLPSKDISCFILCLLSDIRLTIHLVPFPIISTNNIVSQHNIESKKSQKYSGKRASTMNNFVKSL